ncbi:MAG: quinone-dependent dihydroorotate dehydrogenase [Rickettsiales bacterium]
MIKSYKTLQPLLYMLKPETAHNIAISALKYGLIPKQERVDSPILKQNIYGIDFDNPIGLAAGFDKNAVAIDSLLKQGFSFVEAGTVTPKPQSGNPKPRIFRLEEDEAIINRLGFNNNGIEYFIKNFIRHDAELGIAGANIGKNKNTENAEEDYVLCLNSVYPYVDYITVNISSPNTTGLRDLQEGKALLSLLSAISNAREENIKTYKKRIPILLKIAPDIDDRQCEDIVEAVVTHRIDGIIIGNTTISRPQSLTSPYKQEKGGLSGKPLFSLSTEILSKIYKISRGKVPLIATGGISSANDAYSKICSGANLIQIYSALIYQGFGLVRTINEELIQLIKNDGFSHISEAIGSKSL